MKQEIQELNFFQCDAKNDVRALSFTNTLDYPWYVRNNKRVKVFILYNTQVRF